MTLSAGPIRKVSNTSVMTYLRREKARNSSFSLSLERQCRGCWSPSWGGAAGPLPSRAQLGRAARGHPGITGGPEAEAGST